MTKEEFEAADLPDKTSWYTLLRRDDAGKLVTVPYHVAYKADLERAAALLREAATLSADKSFANYLRMRADALLSDDFQPSDLAWMDMKTNPVDIVIGPIETYEDQLFGYKAAYEGLVLVKDQAWSEKLARFAQFLPALQQGLPVAGQVQGRDARLRRRPQRLRRGLLRRQRQRRRQDHRHQPAQRRGGAAEEGHAPAAAGERDAGEVRHASCCRSRKQLIAEDQLQARHLRCVLRGHDVP